MLLSRRAASARVRYLICAGRSGSDARPRRRCCSAWRVMGTDRSRSARRSGPRDRFRRRALLTARAAPPTRRGSCIARWRGLSERRLGESRRTAPVHAMAQENSSRSHEGESEKLEKDGGGTGALFDGPRWMQHQDKRVIAACGGVTQCDAGICITLTPGSPRTSDATAKPATRATSWDCARRRRKLNGDGAREREPPYAC